MKTHGSGRLRRKKKNSSGLDQVQRHTASLDKESISRMISDSGKPYAPKGADLTGRMLFNSSRTSGGLVQPKLEISQPQDKAEQQADKVAEAVSKGDASLSKSALAESRADIHTKSEENGMSTNAAFDSQLAGTKGQGQKLGNDIRTEMEAHLNTDLSGVNVHTGMAAQCMSEGINAKAFTHGQDVYFNEGQYNPSGNEGKSLLAHELTHTVQQQETIQRKEKKPKRPAPTSTKEEAQKLISNTKLPGRSEYWPKVDPVKYMANVSANVGDSTVLYQGKSTNFCGYAAMMTYVIEKDPAGYTQMMIDLYTNGEAIYHGGDDIHLKPRTKTRKGKVTKLAEAAGSEKLNDKFKNPNILDDQVRGVADQVMFLSMADSFKGYVNPDRSYDEGNENTVWAGTNLGKFMDMMVEFGYEAKEWGSDLGDPFHNTPKIVIRELAKGNDVFLYVHSHTFKISPEKYKDEKPLYPTHFMRVRNFTMNKTIDLQYWDYGKWNEPPVKGMSLGQFNRSTFGVISVKKSSNDQNKKIN
jgi:hypothetical protein